MNIYKNLKNDGICSPGLECLLCMYKNLGPIPGLEIIKHF